MWPLFTVIGDLGFPVECGEFVSKLLVKRKSAELGSERLVAGAGFEPTYSFGEGALILGEIEVAPNVTTCQYVQNEAFLSVIVSKTSGALPRPFPTSSADTR